MGLSRRGMRAQATVNVVCGRGERGGGTEGLIAISTVGKIGDQSKARNLLQDGRHMVVIQWRKAEIEDITRRQPGTHTARFASFAVREDPEKASRGVCRVQQQRCMLCLGGAGDAIFMYDDYSSSGNTLPVSGES